MRRFLSWVQSLDPWLLLGWATVPVYLVFIVLPLAALVIKTAQQGDLLSSLANPITLAALRLSLVTSSISMGVMILVGTPFALLLARRHHPLLRLLDSLVELPIVLPPVVAGVALLMAFGRLGILGGPLESLGIGIPFTTMAVIFSQLIVASPFYIRAARVGFQNVAPEYEDISQTLGVSPWTTFWRVTLPLAAPGLLAGLGLAWARALAEFGATIMFAGNLIGKTQTMPLAIMITMESDLSVALGLSVILLIGSVAALLALGWLARLTEEPRP
jgi:molybdate transport system permease protein